MRLSVLQKHILKQCFEKKGQRISKAVIYKFYNNKKSRSKAKDIINIVTKCVERMIKRDLITGYGIRTATRWYIKEIKLTPKGRRKARKLLGIQQKLPFKK